MTSLEKATAMSAPNPWILSLGIVFGGGILLGGLLLVVAAVKAAAYSGFGDSGGVYGSLTWGFVLTALSIAALAFLLTARAIIRRLREGR